MYKVHVPNTAKNDSRFLLGMTEKYGSILPQDDILENVGDLTIQWIG